MYRVGLTGGIGSGKSTVGTLFAARGAGLVDADAIARELTEPGSATLERIVQDFGATILTPEGALDRAALRARVFLDPSARARLESILHPEIQARMLARADGLAAPYALLMVPLLFETGQDRLMDRVLVVDCPRPLQIERVQGRSALDAGEIRRILATQLPRAERRARADDLIDNSGAPEGLEPQVERLHQLYLALAAGTAPGSAPRRP